MVERQTTLGGFAASIAVVRAVMMALTSGKPGIGSKFEGISKNTPFTPVKAAVSAVASFISARASSHPRSFQAPPLAASRTTARTDRLASSRAHATPPPTCPVIPVTAYMLGLQQF